MRYLSGTDTQMLYADTRHAQNLIAPIGVYDPSTAPGGQVTFDQVLNYVRARLHVSDAFRERLVRVPLGLDRPVWIRDADFDLEYHVRELALPTPGDWRQLCTQIGRLGARPLDLTRPPWELYVIYGVDAVEGVPPGSFATLLKLHHAAVDGVAGAELVTALLQPSPDAEPPAEPDSGWTPESTPSAVGMLVRAGVQTVLRPVTSGRMLLSAVGVAPRSVRNAVRPPKGMMRIGPVTATRFNKPISPHRVWDMVRFELSDIKQIKNAVPGTSVNDVALTIVGGGLRKYLMDKGELPENSLMTVMPISVRPTLTQKAAMPEVSSGGERGGGNKFAMTMIPLGTDIADPLERLRTMRQTTSSAKEFGVDALKLVETTELIPGALYGTVQRAVTRVANAAGRSLGVHTIVTNVPGPRSPMYFAGARALITSGMAPVVDGMGLINGIASYVDDFSICWTAAREMMPDPDNYAAALRGEFEALRAATLGGEPVGQPAATRRSGDGNALDS
jgi:WS/DGAT/MGAT family acyltransferase